MAGYIFTFSLTLFIGVVLGGSLQENKSDGAIAGLIIGSAVVALISAGYILPKVL